LPAIEQCGRIALQRRVSQLKVVEVRQQSTDRGPHFLTGQVSTQAEMNAVAEREVLGGRTRDEETVWVVEAPRIPVGGGHMQRDDGPFRDRRTRDRGLFGGLTNANWIGAVSRFASSTALGSNDESSSSSWSWSGLVSNSTTVLPMRFVDVSLPATMIVIATINVSTLLSDSLSIAATIALTRSFFGSVRRASISGTKYVLNSLMVLSINSLRSAGLLNSAPAGGERIRPAFGQSFATD
jgi:hypothetical protein